MKLSGKVLTPEGFVEGSLILEGERVGSIRPGVSSGHILLPGFVDLHVHGGGGADVMDGAEGIAAVAAFHAGHGTTSLCPTTVTRPAPELEAVVAAAASLPDDRARARILGVHLEGPFIAESKRGAQPDHVQPPDLEVLEQLLNAGPVSVVTLAPEVEGALSLVGALKARGIRASLGHSACDYAAASAAFDAGAGGVTHLYNAMSGTHHRDPGLAAAALDRSELIHELILDGHHVHAALFRLAHRAVRLALVSDAIRATGLGDGPSELGGQTIDVRGGRATLPDGVLAGSVLTLDRALANAVDAGLSLREASTLLSANPADALGRKDVGRLVPGAFADVVELDAELTLVRVFRSGVEVPR